MIRRFLILIFLLTPPIAARAEDVPIESIKLRVCAALPPAPALNYVLLPELKDMSRGNGAIQYYRSFSPEWLTHTRQPDWSMFADYATMPLKELPRKKLDWVLRYRPLKELDVASRKETCDWDLTDRIRQDGVGLLLPDMQSFRQMAILLAVKARLQIADGHYDDALYTLQTGLMLGKRVGEAPLFVSHLVGVAICSQMLAQLEELLQAPDAPNLYWALTHLPHPLIDLRKPLEGESLWLATYLPQLPDLQASLKAKVIAPISAEQEKALISGLSNVLGVALYDEHTDFNSPQRRLAMTALCVKAYPEAKKALIALGHSAKDVEALPVIQVVALHAVMVYLQLRDDLYKWLLLPYAEGREGLDQADRQIRQTKASMNVVPIFGVLPGIARLAFTNARLERRIGALRCIEASRMYAAAHAGRPPASLSLLKEVPVPLDPITGRAFKYKAAGDKATLYGPPPGKEQPNAGNVLSYEFTIVR
jgi:hypothetical protein